MNINTPNCGQNGVNLTADQLRSQIVAIVDAATNLFAKVDDQPVKNIVRVKSVAFPVTIPVDKVFGQTHAAWVSVSQVSIRQP